jgi:PAS domain S-box-containing protein
MDAYMQETTKVDSGLLGSELKMIPQFRYDLRPIVPAILYLCAYAGLAWMEQSFGLSAFTGKFGLTAGLNLGLLLSYGLWYSPVILAATICDALWIHNLPASTGWIILFCASLCMIEVGAAAAIHRLLSEYRVMLKKGRDLAKFIVVSGLSAMALATAVAVRRALEGSIHWSQLFGQMQTGFIGFAVGILLLTPALVIHVGPWLQTALFGAKSEKRSFIRQFQTFRVDRQGTVFALSFVCLTAFGLWFTFATPYPEPLYVFFLLSIPLVWVAIWRGMEGLSVAVPVLGGLCLAALMRIDGDPESGIRLLSTLIVASANAYMIAIGVTQNKVTAWQMDRRDAILEAVSYAAQQFLGNTGWENGVRDVVRRLGEATSVTRVFLIDNRTPNLGGQVGDTSHYEWTNSALSTESSDNRMLNLLRGEMIEEMAGRLSMGQPYTFRTKNMPRKRQDMLEALGIRSGVLIPMFVDRQWWGCLGLEQCYVDRDWPESEIDGLKMAGQILGTLIASVRVEQQFRQLTGNIQAVFWISSPDGRAKQYVSPGYEEVWGRSCISLQQNPASWIHAIHPEDKSRVSEALMKQVWGEYDEEYRIERPDGSIRWIRDRAFPVRDQVGKVDRIVGIAEDITKQKKAEEQLRQATVMLSSLINHLHSAVVVEDNSRKILHVNQAFNNIFNVPVPPASLFGVDSRLLFIQTAQFAERIEGIIKGRTPVLGEELEWQNRILLRNYVPLSIDENSPCHLWQYQDVTESRHAEEQIKASLKEKEVLLKEIHHRVKNNLQIISSLLNLQSAEIEDPDACQRFKESQDRVKVMALIHERLYQSGDLAKIDFAGYVRSLTGHLTRSYRINASAVRLNLEVESVPMNLDTAIPCGLIINELVSNAYKYAFPKGEGGEIKVRFAEDNANSLRLVVQDTGVGFPGNVNPEESDSLGLKLVRSLTEQLGGVLNYRTQNGFLCQITIPYSRS